MEIGVTGKLFSHEESRRIYRSSARLSGNTAILEHIGMRAFVADVPGIPANGKRHIQFEYSQIVHVDSDLAKYTYPLSLAKSADGPIADLAVEMEIESDPELRTIYSPSHEVTINRKDDHHVCISYKGVDIDPTTIFNATTRFRTKILGSHYSRTVPMRQKMGISCLTFRLSTR